MISANAALTLTGFYDYREVARSVLIAIAASYAGLDLAGRITAARDRVRLAWLSGGAIAMGTGIWAMQLKGMLAFHLPVPIVYHWPTVLAALLVAIFASAVALDVASRQKMGGVEALAGSVIMGAGIAGLHYLLMAAMRLPAITRYSDFLVACSILLAVLFSLFALLMAFGLREETRGTVPRRVGSAIVMGIAISAMHYTGMAAASFFPGSPPDLSRTVSNSPIGGFGVVMATLIVLIAAIITSSVDRQAHAEIQRLNEELELRVAERTLQLETVNQSLRKEIAERERAEDELRRQKEILERIFENIPAMIAFFAADGRIELVNPEWERTIGWTLKEIRERNLDIFVELYPDPQYRQIARDYAVASTGGRSEFKVRVRDGRVIDMATHVVQLSDGSRLGIGQDITERKRAEAELRESEARFRLVADSAPVLIWMSGTDKLCTHFNKPWLDFTGRSLEQELGNGWAEGVHPEDLRRCMTTYSEAFDRREAFRMEYRLRRHDGEFRWISDIGVPRFSPDGSFAGYIGSCIDVTEQKRAEEQLRQAQADLARVTRMAAMGELAAAIAHQVNQPLGAVVTYGSASLRWLAGQLPNLQEAREAIERTVREATRASEVIARIRALLQKGSPQMVRLDVNAVIREVLILVASELLRGDVTVRTQLAPDVPVVLGDRIQLQQVVLNLILNAIDAMSTITGQPRELLITSAKHPEGALVQVQDVGEAVDPAQADHIFEPFFTTKPQGIGMGLSIGRSIVEAHGGRLWFTPGSSRGTIFQFTVPKADGVS